MRHFIIAVVAVLVAFSSLPDVAEAQSRPSRKATTVVYSALTAADIDALLVEAGYTDVERVSDKQVNVVAQDGFRFTLLQAACDAEGEPEGCLGLNIQATWDIKASDLAALEPALDQFNSDYALGKALLFPDMVMLDRYAITDGGVTLMHIREEIAEFLTMSEILEAAMTVVLD